MSRGRRGCEVVSFDQDGLIRNKRPPKAHRKLMSSIKDRESNEGSNGSEVEAGCESPISEVRGLDNVKVTRNYSRGSVLFREGQRSNGVHVLCEGRAKVSITSAEGKTLILRIAQPGDLLGMNATLTGQPYGATAETLERCRIDFISTQDIVRMLGRDRKACLSVAESLGRKLSGVVEHARLLFLSQSAAEKLARLLITWCDEQGKRTAQGIRINSGLTHEEMGQMISSSRETVTRVFGELKRKHIVSIVDNAIFVRNRKALESVARC